MASPLPPPVLSLGLFVAAFSFALTTRTAALQARLGACGLLVALVWATLTEVRKLNDNHDLLYVYATTLIVVLFHACDYLVVLRASSREYVVSQGTQPTFLRQYVLTPVSMLCNWRRIGTQWQIDKIPPFSPRSPAKTPSRAYLIATRVVCMGLCWVAIDLCEVSVLQYSEMMTPGVVLARVDRLTMPELLFRAEFVVRYFICAVTGVYMGYAGVTLIGLVLGLNSPQDCPPMFGSLRDAYTVRGYWGDFYHQGLRRAITGPADAFVDHILRIRRGTLLSRYLRLTLAFALSGVIHWGAEVSSGVAKPDRSQFLFFTSQAFAVMVEDSVQNLYKRSGRPLPALPEGLVGYAWVAGWMLCAMPYMGYSGVVYGDPLPSKLKPAIFRFLARLS
ncbi:membrane bound O-acyl transferase family-domain-containing protein [Emericellopsis atlantica]|uniref:Membrane bound O-acyl transferase family-domain-containing protein n=1 Tax=Emericellopsis atlantica TaxID=2614577 RepID=A0A9P8CQ67_9HYPO|nr:membrane bound O-acyl transferase family-domain-containing protein [Emericellopsis atlantica]KAG9254982.1 membrane bound O-acyl transferase family-domain-containing protein [Emericellopsis atlantica]